MKLYLRDRNQELVNWWKKVFDGDPDVHISCGDIFADGEHMTADAIVSPANSFGFMDGGIDYVYSEFFGWELQRKLQDIIDKEYNGELLVGQAVIVDIRTVRPDSPIKYLISAPTMRVPLDVSKTVNAYLAFVAALRAAAMAHFSLNIPATELPESILCPGLGTAVGQMPYSLCAIQMHAAWRRYLKPKMFDVLGLAHTDHHSMLNPELYMLNLKAHNM